MSSIIPYTCQDSKGKRRFSWQNLAISVLCNVLAGRIVSLLEHFLLRGIALGGSLPGRYND